MRPKFAFVCALIVVALLCTSLCSSRTGVGAADGGDSYHLYIPLVTKPPPLVIGVYPSGSWYLNAEGENLADTLAGGVDYLWRYDHTASVWNLPPGPGRPLYHVNRAFLHFDLSEVPAGTIVSATLEFRIWNRSVRGDFDTRFYQGNWDAPPTADDWDSYGSLLGILDTGEATTGLEHNWIPLPGLVGKPVPDILNLVARGDEMTELGWGEELSVCLRLWEDEPVSRLWLALELPYPYPLQCFAYPVQEVE